MDNERNAVINIGGTEFELMLTTRATKEIARRYGGLENLGEKLLKSENFEMALDEIVWLITLLANQSILVHNLKNRDNPKEPLSEEDVELLTSPLELAAYKNAITEASAISKARKRMPPEVARQKTRRSGNGHGGLYPTLLLRSCADGHERGRILAYAHRFVSRPMGLP